MSLKPGKAIERLPEPDGDGSQGVPARETSEISFIALANVLLRYRRLLIALPLAFGTVTLVLKLLEPRTYTATASFIPQETEASSGGGFASVAAQFGFRLPSSRPSESPAFYAALLESRAILGQLVDAVYTYVRDGETRSGDLIELYGIEGETEGVRREKAMRRLNRNVVVTPSRQTDIVELAVTETQPAVAKQIAERALALVNEFNIEKRRSYAREERDFVEARVAQAREELRAAEAALRDFLQRNREFRNSPDLSLRHDALEREVGMRQEVYTTLAQSYEQARIDEVRNIPVITVLDPPAMPVRGNARGTVGAVLFAGIIGFVIALAIAIVREFLRSTHQRADEDYIEFSRIWREMVSELRRPWRPLRHRRETSVRGDR